jgi:hypothetical protein
VDRSRHEAGSDDTEIGAMRISGGRLGFWFLLVLGLCSAALAQQAPPSGRQVQQATATVPADHPLAPVIQWAHAAHKRMEMVADYSCTFVKRERIGDELTEHQYLAIKLRHKPFSVYVNFLAPASVKGQEAIYVEGQNDGHLLAHSTGLKDTLIGTLKLKPDGMLAMKGNRHPITEMGLLNLTGKIAKVCEQSVPFNESQVTYLPGAKVNGRVCTCIQILNPTPRTELHHHLRRIFVDDELQIPIRFETYGWPAKPGEEPPLEEEYTYLNLKFNHGFTDHEFDVKNPSYRFK